MDLARAMAFDRTLLFTIGVLVFTGYAASRYFRVPSVYDKFVHIGNPILLPKFLGKSANVLIGEGYSKVILPLDIPFVMKWWAKDYLIMPPKYLPDLRHTKPENATFLKNFSDAVNLQHSVGNLYESERMGDIVKKGLNPILPALTPTIANELEYAIGKEIGHCPEWKAFKATELFISLSHRVASRLIAGEELCRNEDFIHRSMRFSDSMMLTALIIAQLPLGPLRWPVGYLIMQYHRWLLYRAMRLVQPVVRRRMAEAHKSQSVPCCNDSIEWAIKLNNPFSRDARTISLELLHLLEAASGAPGALITEAIFQILMDRHLCDLLLEEIKSALGKDGISDATLQHLPLVDSFLMEVNRLYGVGGVTAARTVMYESLVLHDGLTLPPHTRIGFPCKSIHLDPRIYPDPFRFDALRFTRLSSKENAEAEGEIDACIGGKCIASKAMTGYLPWGYGVHACPGRFYTIRLAKLVLMILLSKYEIQWADEPNGGLKQRPCAFEIEGQFLPNMEQKINIRAKTGKLQW